jgi:hypothetical protein
MIGHAPSVGLSLPDGAELLVAVLFAIAAIVAFSMIATVFSDQRSQGRLSAAARTAAHDAALEDSPDRAMLAAQRAAASTLTDLERFGRPMIVVDVSQFRTSGLVEVTVACTVAPRPIGPIDRAVQLRQATASASIHPGLARH